MAKSWSLQAGCQRTRIFCFEAENGFAYAEPHYSIVETDGENPQHIGVLNALRGRSYTARRWSPRAGRASAA